MPTGRLSLSKPLSTSSVTAPPSRRQTGSEVFLCGKAAMAKPAWATPIRPFSSAITSYAASTHSRSIVGPPIVVRRASSMPCCQIS